MDASRILSLKDHLEGLLGPTGCSLSGRVFSAGQGHDAALTLLADEGAQIPRSDPNREALIQVIMGAARCQVQAETSLLHHYPCRKRSTVKIPADPAFV